VELKPGSAPAHNYYGFALGRNGSLEQAIGEAQALGEIEGTNPKAKARDLMNYFEGALARARIENNPELIRELGSDALALLRGRSVLTTA